jgi:DNA polymerase-1
MERVRELLDAFNIPIIEYPGYEADDVAGTLAKRIAATGMRPTSPPSTPTSSS